MKTLEWLHKYGIIVIITLLVLTLLQTCSTGVKVRKISKITEQKLDSININLSNSYIMTQEELRIRMDIQRLQTSKQILYDWNSIVRTVVRPDDRMNYYDNEISKLENQLDQLRANRLLKDQ
jgi:hypothetical protein